MAADWEQERTEAATPRRRERAREEGQVARSREVVSAGLFVGIILFFYFAGLPFSRQMFKITRMALSSLDSAPESPDEAVFFLSTFLVQTILMLLPLFLTVLVLAILCNVVQVGFLLTPKALELKLSRISPGQGLRRIFSLQSVNELFKSLVKIGIVGYIAYATIRGALGAFLPLANQGIPDILHTLGSQAMRVLTRTAYAMVVLAVLDYAFQRWQYERDLRMTREEVKEERKEQEGDPQIRARVRSVMREMSRRRMMQEVPKADVVITNPTHLAVALRYDRQEMIAPQVVAKGRGYVAERIKAIAQEHRVPVIENRPVAQQLFRMVEVGECIPAVLYKAVAEILAYVYSLRSSRHGA
ncbi:MAG: flagellar biosynthesis protein FlhB [Nitrospinota bacterium]|nr:MAG: flagellar biosynthesis protein FlhB [Nitrospinota bacterium]